MPTVPAASSLRPADLIEALLGLLAAPRQADFDARYCELVRQLCQADGVLMQQIQGEATHTLASSGDPAAVEELSSGQGASLWDACQAQGYTHDNLVRADGSPWVRLGLRLIAAQPTLLLLAFSEKQKAHLKEALVRAMLVKDIRSPTGRDTSTDLVTQASSPEMLELLALASQVMQAPHFGQAGLTLVNGLVRQLGLRQCALCWRKGQHAELIAISHLERFEKTSPLVHEFEKAAQEVLVVDRIIEVAPTALAANEVTSNVPPSHLALLKALQAPAGLLSIPIRDRSGETQAVVFCLPEDSMLPPNDINQLLLMLELVLPKLQASRQSSMGWLKRWQTFMLPHLQQLLGPGQPWLKFWSVLTTLTLLILLLGRYPYSVEATAQLTTDSTRILTSQNDGRLLEVLVDMGDWVKSDQVLSRMDTVELRQQELEIRSEIQRFQAEEEKARAAGALADLQVSHFKREQSQARLKRLLYLLEQAEIKAPFEGVVVEGERRNLLGSSVRRGDKIFRVAKVENLYVVLQVPERDVRDVFNQANGRLVLLSQPGKEIHFRISNFVPMAQVKGEEGNQFLIKAVITDPVQDWWRPGMTGLAKVDVGSRNIGWILLHRVIDTLRLKFWL
jgi:hypothetical protein